MFENVELFCQLPSGKLDWRENGLGCLSAISLGNAHLTEVPNHIVLPGSIVQLCDGLWRLTKMGNPPKEWIAFLLTTNECDIYYCYEEGERHSAPADVRPGTDGIGLVMVAHTHPNQSYPSTTDLGLLTSDSGVHLHAAAHLVVSGPYTFLMLRDERGAKPRGWVYGSEDRVNYTLLSDAEMAAVYGA